MHFLLKHFPNQETMRILAMLGFIFGIIIILNPITSINLFLTAIYLLIVGDIFFREKLLLVFLFIRPTLDYWRDKVLFVYKESSININAAIAIIIIIWSISMLIRYYKKIKFTPIYIPLAAITILVFASTLWSISPVNTLIESTKWLDLILLFWLCFLFVKENAISQKELMSSILLGAVIPVIFGSLQLISGSGISTFGINGRIFGTMAHPNVFAFFLLSIFMIQTDWSIVNIQSEWSDRRGLRSIIFFILVTLLLFTYTRAAFVGLLIFLVVIGVYGYRKQLIALGLFIFTGYLVFFPFNRWLINEYNLNLQSIPIIGRITAINEDADSIEWRQSLLRETIPIIYARPLLGYGYGTFEKVWGDNRNLAHQWDDSAEAHNDYLRLALEIGLIGLALYLSALGSLFGLAVKKLKTDPKKYIVLFGSILVFVAMSLSDNMLHHTPALWITWSYWGAALANKKI